MTSSDDTAVSEMNTLTYKAVTDDEMARELLRKKAREENSALVSEADVSEQKRANFPSLHQEKQEALVSEVDEAKQGHSHTEEEVSSDKIQISLSPEDLEKLAKKQDLERLQEELTETIEKKVVEEIADLKGQLRQETDQLGDKVLDQYSSEVKEEFFERVKEAGEKGLDKQDIMEIFDVKTSRANDLQHQLAADHPFLEYENSRSKKGFTRHKKHAYIEFLSRNTGKSKKELGDCNLKVLEQNYERIQEKQEQGKEVKNSAFR